MTTHLSKHQEMSSGETSDLSTLRLSLRMCQIPFLAILDSCAHRSQAGHTTEARMRRSTRTDNALSYLGSPDCKP